MQLFTKTCQKHVIECNFAVYSTLYSTYMQVGVTYSDKWPWYVGIVDYNILVILWGQPIKLIQVVSSPEFHEY